MPTLKLSYRRILTAASAVVLAHVFASQAFAMGKKPPLRFDITRMQTTNDSSTVCKDGTNSTQHTIIDYTDGKLVITDQSASRSVAVLSGPVTRALKVSLVRSGNSYLGDLTPVEIVDRDGSKTKITGTMAIEVATQPDGKPVAGSFTMNQDIQTDDGTGCLTESEAKTIGVLRVLR